MTLKEVDENKEVVDEVCKEVFRVLNALKHPDVSEQVNDSKEFVFERVNDKIKTDSILTSRMNGKRVNIRFLVAAGIALLLLMSVSAAYHLGHKSGQELKSNLYAETVTPLGVTTKITLPDGTVVTLNGGSKLTYPTLFAGKERCVSLSGEGFFEVAKDAEHPFLVNADNLSVKVLGTKFGFKSYKDDNQTIVTLKEGLVKAMPSNKEAVNGIVLRPNQQLVLDNRTGEFQCRNVNTAEYLSWKEGVLYFRDTTLDEIAKILERKFNVKILIASESLKNDRYFAHFGYNENLEQILTLLSHKRFWKYEKKNGTIEIRKKY